MPLCIWQHAELGSRLLGDVCTCCELDVCQIPPHCSILHGLDTKIIDFVLAFPKTEIDTDIFLEIPAGMRLNDYAIENQSGLYVLKLNKSLYGLKQASANWYEMLTKGLIDQGFKQFKVDPCVFI